MKARSDLIGSGRTGNIVGYKGYDGEYYIRKYVRHIKNPNTDKQRSVRTRMTMIAQNLGRFSLWAKEMISTDGKRPPFSELIKINFDNVFDGTFPNIRFNWSKVQIAKGKTALPYNVDISVSDGIVSIEWDDNTGQYNARKDDSVYLLLYNYRNDEQMWLKDIAKRDDCRVSFNIPRNWEGKTAFVYFAMKATADDSDKQPSNSYYLGEIPMS